jgi:hypothetical protein
VVALWPTFLGLDAGQFQRWKTGNTWGRFFVHFFGGKFRENSAEIFPLKNVGENWNYLRKSFEKLFPQEIPRKIPFRKKIYETSAPGANPTVTSYQTPTIALSVPQTVKSTRSLVSIFIFKK